jgi:hypothetical protein
MEIQLWHVYLAISYNHTANGENHDLHRMEAGDSADVAYLHTNRERSAEANMMPVDFLAKSRTLFRAREINLVSADAAGIHVLLSVVTSLCNDDREFQDSCLQRLAQMVRVLSLNSCAMG